jgi:hypothetical protein
MLEMWMKYQPLPIAGAYAPESAAHVYDRTEHTSSQRSIRTRMYVYRIVKTRLTNALQEDTTGNYDEDYGVLAGPTIAPFGKNR